MTKKKSILDKTPVVPVQAQKKIERLRAIRTSMTYTTESADIYEYPYGKLITVPNQVLTPKEMLERFTRGIPLDTSSRTPYYSDVELPDLDKLDLSELHELKQENDQILQDFEKSKTKKQKAEQTKLLKEQLRKELEEENNPPSPPKRPTDPPPVQ